MTEPDVFAKAIALKPGEILELSKDEARTFFHWRMPDGDVMRAEAEVLGFLRVQDLKMDRNELCHCWRICK